MHTVAVAWINLEREKRVNLCWLYYLLILYKYANRIVLCAIQLIMLREIYSEYRCELILNENKINNEFQYLNPHNSSTYIEL